MSKLLIQTQVYENYGTADEPYWKPKGGADYVVKKFRDYNRVTETVMALRPQIEQDNEYYRSTSSTSKLWPTTTLQTLSVANGSTKVRSHIQQRS